MKSFQQKRKFRNAIYSIPVLVLLGSLVFFFTWAVVSLMNKMNETVENKKIVESKVVELEKEQEKLSVDIAKLETENGIEENIREKFGLVKEGEGLIIIVENKNPPVVKDLSQGGFFSSLRDWFK